MKINWDDAIPNIWENMFQTTDQWWISCILNGYGLDCSTAKTTIGMLSRQPAAVTELSNQPNLVAPYISIYNIIYIYIYIYIWYPRSIDCLTASDLQIIFQNQLLTPVLVLGLGQLGSNQLKIAMKDIQPLKAPIHFTHVYIHNICIHVYKYIYIYV